MRAPRSNATRHSSHTAKAYLESMLANLSAGVLAFDEGLTAARRAICSAGVILEIEAESLTGIPLAEWRSADLRLAAFSEAVREAFEQRRTTSGRSRWSATPAAASARCSCAAPVFRPRTQPVAWWYSTTSRTCSRRSATPPGPRWRGGSRTRSRTRSRRSSSRRSALQLKLRDKLAPADAEMLDALDPHHRQPGGGAEEHGRRLQPVRALAEPDVQRARPESARARDAHPVRRRWDRAFALELAPRLAAVSRAIRRNSARSSTTCCRTPRTRWRA